MLFTKFDVVSSDQTELQLLKAPTSIRVDRIVLQADPGFDSHASSFNGQSVAYKDISSDHAELRVQTDRPAILLFDDSFDAGWKAKVNGQPQKVMMANFNFMAIPIPAGDSNIVLEYRPFAFQIGAICAAASLIVMVLAFAVYLVRRRQAGRPSVAAP